MARSAIGYWLVCALGVTGCAHVANPGARRGACPTTISLDPNASATSLFGTRVAVVCVLGDRLHYNDEFISIVAHRKGRTLDAAAVREDIKALFDTGVIQNVRAVGVLEGSPLEATLIYEVNEYDSLSGVTVESDSASPFIDELVDSYLLRPFTGKPISPIKLRQTMALTLEECQAEGYPQARVWAELEPLGRGEVRAKVHFNGGLLITVASIRIEGAHRIPEADVRHLIASVPGKPFSEAAVLHDTESIQSLYYDEGMANVVVTAFPRESSSGFVALAFVIEEGDVFRLGEVKLVGVMVEPEKDLIQALETRTNGVYSRTGVRNDMALLKSRALSRGVRVEVTPVFTVNNVLKTVDIKFQVEKSAE